MALRQKNKVGRNEPCPCGSGLKSKHCHQDPGKIAICEAVVREKMLELVRMEQRKQIIKGQQADCGICFGKGKINDELCLDCQFINDEERIQEEYKRLSEGEKQNE